MSDKLCEEVSHLAISRFAQEKFLEDGLTGNTALGSFLEVNLLFVFPVNWHRTIFTEIVIVVKVLLILDDGNEHVEDTFFDSLSDARKTKHFLENLVSNLLGRHLSIEHMLLEEGILAIHMCAIE